MGTTESPTWLEIDVSASAAAMRAFISWARSDRDLKVLFTPDVMMAIDGPQRRGLLIDEVYFVTVWVDRGIGAFRDCLERELPGEQRPWTMRPAGSEPAPEGLLSAAVAHGRPITSVGHLL